MINSNMLKPISGSSLMLILAATCSILLLTIGPAEAQSYTGIITLDSIPSKVKTGNTITFSGQLATTSGHIVPDATIYIKDDVDFGRDTIIGTITTDENGRFAGTWVAQSRNSGSWDFYATYDGASNISKARSTTYSVKVSSSYSDALPPSSSSNSNSYYSTAITLDRLPSSIYAGDSIAFTGKLVSNGQPLEGKLVHIMEDDPFSPDQRLGYGRTDSNGWFSITWNVDAGLIETDFDIYAVFDDDSSYKRARSYNQEMSVLKYGGSITLDPFPNSANVGEVITFSGTLNLDSYNPKGAIVYIKDEDPFTGDELLATGYVDSSGRFSAAWSVDYVDENNSADIYAVFEGNDVLYRLTTCDKNPTRSFGGSCMYTIPLKIYDSAPVTPPNHIPDGNEYMQMYYAMSFDRTPQVAIVPSPDSYDKVSKHIIPVQEGILMWKSLMEQKYGGNWDVNFEVLKPGQMFFSSKPDVVVNLVARNDRDGKNGCNDYYGVAYDVRTSNPTKPRNTVVCSITGGQTNSVTQIQSTAAHEFIHALGLGHTFNKKNDMLCSKEGDRWTCGKYYSKSKIPSDLNLAAVAEIYGTDGFLNPNNHVRYGEKFSLDNSNYDDNPNHIPPSEPRVISYCEQVYDNHDWAINEVLESGWYTYWRICSHDISYSFSTDDKSDGFMIFVLPPATNVEDFIKYRDGKYYTCEEYEQTWHKKSNTCNIAPGSHIVLQNAMENTIRVDGQIRNR